MKQVKKFRLVENKNGCNPEFKYQVKDGKKGEWRPISCSGTNVKDLFTLLKKDKDTALDICDLFSDMVSKQPKVMVISRSKKEKVCDDTLDKREFRVVYDQSDCNYTIQVNHNDKEDSEWSSVTSSGRNTDDLFVHKRTNKEAAVKLFAQLEKLEVEGGGLMSVIMGK